MSTSRISSVAYATEDRGSEANTARATVLLRRSCRACASGIGLPTTRRFTRASRMASTSTLILSVMAGTASPGFLRVFNGAGADLDARLRPQVASWSRCLDVRHERTYRKLRSVPPPWVGRPLRAGRAHALRVGGRRNARRPGHRADRAPVWARPGRFRRDGRVDATQSHGARPHGLV